MAAAAKVMLAALLLARRAWGLIQISSWANQLDAVAEANESRVLSLRDLSRKMAERVPSMDFDAWMPDEALVVFDDRVGTLALAQTSGRRLEETVLQNMETLLAVLATPAMLWILRLESMKSSSLPVILVVSVLYLSASLSMNVLNKKAAHQFQATCLLVIIQMLISDVVIVLMEFDKMKIGKWQDLAKWFVVPVAFAGMLGTSMYAFKEASLTTILILRNALPILTFCVEKALFDRPKTAGGGLVATLVCTLVGSMMYGFADISASAWGKVLLVVNCLFTIVDRLVQAHLLKGQTDFSISIPLCMLLNNTLGILPIFGLAVAKGETEIWASVIEKADRGTWAMVLISGMVGTSLGYVGLRVQQLVSGTSVLVLQNFNKVLIIAIGLGLFKERMTQTSLAGCALSLFGSVAYGYMRLPSEAKEDKDESMVPSKKTGTLDVLAKAGVSEAFPGGKAGHVEAMRSTFEGNDKERRDRS